MTILWIYDMPLNPEAGGTERMTYIIAKGLADDGHKCLGQMEVTSSALVLNGTEITDLYTFLRDQNVDIVINQECRHNNILTEFLNKGGERWHNEGGIIISCLHFDTKITNAVYHHSVKLNKTIHDYISLTRAYLSKSTDQKKIDSKLGEQYRWCYDHSDYFITLSEKFNPYFKRVCHLTRAPKLISINNPLTFDTISPLSIIETKEKVVLICARMDEYQKRISLALKAWEKVKKHKCSIGWTLKIVGDGPNLDQYIQIVETKKIPDVIFEGRQNPESYYSEASLFLMTSGFEGWGLTLTESLQRGVVPIAMNTVSVFSEIIQHRYNGFLTKASNLTDFANHICLLMEDNNLLRVMQKNALFSARRFTLDKTMEKWRKIIPPAHKF